MKMVGIRELRQNASEIIREAEQGEEITVTVSGRPAVRLIPVQGRKTWNTYEEIKELFELPEVVRTDSERDAFDRTIVDPWERFGA